jgi:hypothetical protein
MYAKWLFSFALTSPVRGCRIPYSNLCSRRIPMRRKGYEDAAPTKSTPGIT